jgi:hypothetical protein
LTEDSTKTPTATGADTQPVKVTISIPQIVGGALAAATAAAIGSQLGVAGTIFGAAVASVVGGVAGTFYSAGIEGTHRKVTGAIQRGYQRVRPAEDAEDLEAEAVATGEGMPEAEEDPAPTTLIAPVPPAASAAPSRSAQRRFWERMALTVGAIFVAALLTITVIELGLGHSLDGTSGTTVGQVNRPKSVPSTSSVSSASATQTTPAPTPTPEQSTPSASQTPSAEPTPSASPTPTALPTPAATTS